MMLASRFKHVVLLASMIGVGAGVLPPRATFCAQETPQGQRAAPEATSEAALAQAQALIDQGKNDQAIALLDGVARTAPQTAGLEAKLGKAYYEKRGYLQAAARILTEA